ncbi:hypothetical protein [Corynebacterium sp.]|uniref:hypothetical protein n=1 Tax=Corynebacterium sp. TaxID=1720 RepID=UPI0028AEE54C|nr:hypothetical protein [Corynebacterium sp.]
MSTLHDILPMTPDGADYKHWADYTPAERAHVQAVRDRIARQYPDPLVYVGDDVFWAWPEGLPDDHDDALNRVVAGYRAQDRLTRAGGGQ